MVHLHNPFAGHVHNMNGPEAEESLAQNLEAQGANVQTFSEDASPEDKARQAAQAFDEIKPRGELAEAVEERKKEKKVKVVQSIPSDLGGVRVRPNVSLRDVDTASRARGQLGDGQLVPGALPAGQPSMDIPDWFTVGWIDASRTLLGLTPDQLELTEQRMRDTDLVSSFLTDAYYGYVWFDGAAIVSSVLATYYATRFGGGLAYVCIVLAICGTYYCTSHRRTRQRIRDDVARELSRQRMVSENETARWINHFLSRFWLIYEPVLAATIIQSVDAVLKDQCPPFLDSLRLTTFTLGTKAPSIDYVRTLSDTDDDVIVMDWKISFTPNDVQDLTVRQAAKKINPKIVLTVRLGKGIVGAGLPILLENMSFVGSLRIRLKLISNFPHVQVVDMSFMEPPSFDYELKPIGGSTLGLDVAALPGLSGFIQNQVHANLGPMMYNPNQFSLNLEELMSGTPLDAAVGVLQVTVWSARDLVGVKFAGGVPDPYVALSLDDGPEIDKTSVKQSTPHPTFKETKYIILRKLEGLLVLTTFDYNDRRPDTRLGVTKVNLQMLEEKPDSGQLNKAVMYNGAAHGSVQFSLHYFPVLKPQTATDGSPKPLPETNAGIVRLTLHQARDLVSKSVIPGEMEPRAKLLLNDKVIKETPVIKSTRDPIFENVTEFLVTDRASSVLSVHIIDDRELAGKPVVASISARIEDLISAKLRQQDWFPVPDTKRTCIRLSSQWKPVVMAGSINGSNSYRPPIGALKVWIRGAHDVKNVEALSGGKSDPYALLRVNNLPVSGTAVIMNNLSPLWNQVLYAPVHSSAEIVRLEVLDYQNSTADRTLGYCDLAVSQFCVDDLTDPVYRFHSNGRHTRNEPLKQTNGTVKGMVDFDVEFKPAMNVAGANFIEQNKRMVQQAKKAAQNEPDARSVGALETPDAQPTPDVAPDGHVEAAADDMDQVVAGHAVEHEEEEDGDEALHLSPEELKQYQSGVLAFNLISGTISKQRAQLEVVFDDAYWPSYITERRKQTYNWDEVGEVVIRELDVSHVWFRLRTGSSDDDVFAEYMCSTRELMEKAMVEPTELTLLPLNGAALDFNLGNPVEDLGRLQNQSTERLKSVGGLPSKLRTDGTKAFTDGAKALGSGATQLSDNALSLANQTLHYTHPLLNKIKVSCRYIPMDVHLEPVESIVNQGALSIELIRADHLRSADRGGKSDPYVLFEDNGVVLAKSKTVKRSLHPVFNETLPEVNIKSRLTHDYTFNVRDWDQVGSSDPLGIAHINLAELEPFVAHEQTYPLVGKGSTEKSTISVRLSFRPQYVNNRTRKNTAIRRNITSGLIGGIGGIGKGVAHGGKSVGHGFFSVLTGGKHHSHENEPQVMEAPQQDGYVQGSTEQKAPGAQSFVLNDEATSMRDSASMYQGRSEDGEPRVRQRRSRLQNPFKRAKEPAQGPALPPHRS
ncbi:hypothetical protein MVES1_000567 [Malassezia vespertilionis]|uniref:uncharacterized protein n=1 Tax=Malassezia vespertilionis TaxID=2020962 RepID=UPI0024B063B9|nr:uncharacterized protein MVES1_000567 [Malassezia vespertilionis]WFD05239.1 hypothetical protein MVES1_000567 [Malassezia vespertilionis]